MKTAVARYCFIIGCGCSDHRDRQPGGCVAARGGSGREAGVEPVENPHAGVLFPDYYTRLAKMEAEAEAEANGNAQSE